jgi:hypothetical protein
MAFNKKNSLVGIQVAEIALDICNSLENELHEVGLQTNLEGTTGPIVLASSYNDTYNGNIRLISNSAESGIWLKADSAKGWVEIDTSWEGSDALVLDASSGTTGGIIIKPASNGTVAIGNTSGISESNINIKQGAGNINIGTSQTGPVNIGNTTGNTTLTGTVTTSPITGGYLYSSVPAVTGSIGVTTLTCNGKVGSVTFRRIEITDSNNPITLIINNTKAGSDGLISVAFNGPSPGSSPYLLSTNWSAGNNITIIINNSTMGNSTGPMSYVVVKFFSFN